MQTMNAANSEKKTIVDEDTHLKGSVSSTCPIVVRGKIEGELVAPSLEVSATGGVSGKVKVGQLVSAGELSGQVEAESARISGVVKDKTVLKTQSLEVTLAADGNAQVRFGACTLEVGE